MAMPPMLAYTISSYSADSPPSAIIGYGRDSSYLKPDNPQSDSYWIAILNAKNPRVKVKEWIVPGASHSAVPPGIDTYMNDPEYLFVLGTQYLSTLHVPQGPFYDFLVKYGAGRELQKLEQVATVLSCGSFSRMSYILTGQCGPRKPGQPSPPSYELSTYEGGGRLLKLMSLMPLPDGSPPYAPCDSYTFYHSMTGA